MKRLTNIIKTNNVNEAAIKVGSEKITNQVDDYSKYNTINELCDSVETHYISNYKDSNKIRKILAEKNLIEPLDSKQNDSYPGAVLYKGGHLVYFFWFHKMEYLCAFLVYMHKYLEIFDYHKKLDNKWHLYFDIHGDPLTGVENKSTCWHLEYRCKDHKLENLDKAIDDFYNELDKIEPYSGLNESLNESNYLEMFNKIYGDKSLNESVDEYPNVLELGAGEYEGALWGHCFVFEGKKYYSERGWKNIFPSYCKMVIENNEAFPHQIDIYQREELKKLYE